MLRRMVFKNNVFSKKVSVSVSVSVFDTTCHVAAAFSFEMTQSNFQANSDEEVIGNRSCGESLLYYFS